MMNISEAYPEGFRKSWQKYCCQGLRVRQVFVTSNKCKNSVTE